MNAFQQKLLAAVKGNVILEPLPAITAAELWHDEDGFEMPKEDPKSLKRVNNPLPVPAICPHCAGNVKLMSNSVIYNGTEYGKWPYTYICQRDGCRAYVGTHPGTFIPLGTLATAPIRDARKKAKAAFNPLWEDGGPFTRTGAYTWLAQQLGIKNKEECHIGWFDVATCNRVVEVCDKYLGVND